MTSLDVKRKLAALLSADVKGYSRLMGEDELGTIHTLNAYKEIMRNLIQQHHGRVVDAPGDSLLAEFASVVDAVQCAVEIQKELRIQNADLPENRTMEFRIGINLGDVVEDGEQILGDGVNIAARLESLAEPGGICISGTTYDQVENKLPLGYEYLGEQRVKNIAKPVRVYRVLLEPKAVAHRLDVASKERMAFPLPDKPSVAVLPFVNMSDDPKQEYFSDGVTEEIITALSKISNLFVIARNSTFSYKGKSVKVKQVAEEFGVRYVLEGSIRKAGEKVRVTAQLIDALSGYHLWAERYDRDLKDVFAVQDEITLKVAAALQVNLTVGEHARLMAKGTTNLEAYLKALQCREYGQRWTKDGNAALRNHAEEVIALDPSYPFGYIALALSHFVAIMLGLSESPQQSLTRGIELTKHAISLDNTYSFAHAVLGVSYVLARQYDQGVAEAERAVALDPNSPENLFFLAYVLCFAGKPEEAIPLIEIAQRLNPIPLPFQLLTMSSAYRLTGKYEKAVETATRAIRIAPNNPVAHVQLIAAYIALGHEEEASAVAAELLQVTPNFSVDHFVKRIPYKNQAENDRLADALYKAGLK